MFKASHICKCAVSGVTLLGTIPGAAIGQTVYAIGNGGSSLLRFQANNPGAVTVVASFSGGTPFMDAIDFRPATGQLFGYLDATDSFYTINVTTGATTLASVGASGAPTNTFQLGLDFNPTIDRARIVTDSGQNIVFNPAAGTAAAFTGLFYATGDPNENTSPSIIDNAYTQNLLGASSTQQFVIDYGADVLARLDNNNGTLTTVGGLGVNTDIYTGFDIYTQPNGIDIAYAILTPQNGTPSFYMINLTNGTAASVGALGFTNQVYSLAVTPAPGAAAVMLLATGAGLCSRRRSMAGRRSSSTL